MGEISFKTERFFDLSGFAHAEVFDGAVNVWEVLPKLTEYVKGQLPKGKDVVIGEGTIVEEGAYIKGPAVIGKNCFIAHGAYIRDNVILGNNVQVGHPSEIKNSVIVGNTAVAHLNYICDSILGSNINVGAGAKTANLRLDDKNVRVKVGEEFIDTGLRKFGAIIGDGCKIGVNAVLNPGTVLGKRCLVFPLTSVTGVHGDGEIIK